jgi:hypothetical protein
MIIANSSNESPHAPLMIAPEEIEMPKMLLVSRSDTRKPNRAQ